MTQKTRYCVRCGKVAGVWSCHVLRGAQKIIAGWCSQSCMVAEGFRGQYKKWMRREDDN